jgi:hypothetical protein
MASLTKIGNITIGFYNFTGMILNNTCNYTKTSKDANHQHDLFISSGIIQITSKKSSH